MLEAPAGAACLRPAPSCPIWRSAVSMQTHLPGLGMQVQKSRQLCQMRPLGIFQALHPGLKEGQGLLNLLMLLARKGPIRLASAGPAAPVEQPSLQQADIRCRLAAQQE